MFDMRDALSLAEILNMLGIDIRNPQCSRTWRPKEPGFEDFTLKGNRGRGSGAESLEFMDLASGQNPPNLPYSKSAFWPWPKITLGPLCWLFGANGSNTT